jgi:hypothetical protein
MAPGQEANTPHRVDRTLSHTMRHECAGSIMHQQFGVVPMCVHTVLELSGWFSGCTLATDMPLCGSIAFDYHLRCLKAPLVKNEWAGVGVGVGLDACLAHCLCLWPACVSDAISRALFLCASRALSPSLSLAHVCVVLCCVCVCVCVCVWARPPEIFNVSGGEVGGVYG